MISGQYTRIVVSAIFNHIRQYIVQLQFSNCSYTVMRFPSYGLTFSSLEEAKKIMTAFQKHAGIKFQNLLYELI